MGLQFKGQWHSVAFVQQRRGPQQERRPGRLEEGKKKGNQQVTRDWTGK